MIRTRSARTLAAALGLTMALAVVGTQAQAAWADQPAVTLTPTPTFPGDRSIPTPERIDTGLGGTASQPGLPGPTAMVLLAATGLVVLVLASICWRWTRSSR